MRSHGSPWAVEHQCELCGKDTAVNLRTGRMKVHRPADALSDARETCPASNTLMVDPDPPELATDTTSAAKGTYRCPDCEQNIKVSPRSGRLYSHTPADSTENCPGSSRHVRPENPALGTIVEVTRMDEPSTPSTTEVRSVQSSSSVHAIPAGLPSTGRRRK